ncbi:UNVERIFIED_CONTAM: hypothetical protein Slati_4449500 [Sesamum latifolium]|uniref:DUF4283 domain-containing protein n=1 Tax=Sesamum latifolium TaxID=2727402 RepID=A0AAW2SSJ2_9LAMI
MANRVTEAKTGCFRSSIRLRDDEEEGMVVPDGLWNSDTESFHLCLVGRLLPSCSYNFDRLEIKQLQDGWLLFKFNHKIDRDRALKGYPWSFVKHVLILNDIQVDEKPMHVDLNR